MISGADPNRPRQIMCEPQQNSAGNTTESTESETERSVTSQEPASSVSSDSNSTSSGLSLTKSSESEELEENLSHEEAGGLGLFGLPFNDMQEDIMRQQ